jgi:glycosyltransferase involved in cell wall biosynthesis
MRYGLDHYSEDNALIKVLHFYKTYYPNSMGGVEQAIYQLARQSSKNGIEAIVLSLSINKIQQIIPMDGHIAYFTKQDFQIASMGFSILSILRFKQLAERADIIHYHFPWPFMDLLHFLLRIKKPSIISYHSDIIRQKKWLIVYKPLMNAFMRAADRIVATSPNYFATSKILNRYKDKVIVIPIGLDKASYPRPSYDRIIYWQNLLGKKFFLFVGALRYYKGLEILLSALAIREFPMVIIGSGSIELELKSKADALGLKHIKFLGTLSDEDKVAIIMLSYSVIFPSHLRSEAFGISLLEGAMYAKPLISCEIGTGTTFINIDQVTGYVLPPSDPESLNNAMSSLWHDEIKAAAFGEAAQARYWELFTAEDMAGKYASLYKELIK